MKSDHPLVLLRQQYLLYCKNLINWDVYLAQALDTVINSSTSPQIISPLKSSPHTEITSTANINTRIMPKLNINSRLLTETMIKHLVDKLPNYLKYRD